MESKGLSQILYLIIAASILMMVALSLIFAFQSGIADAGDQADTQTCISSATAQCENLGSSHVIAPNSCYTQQAGTYSTIPGVPFSVDADENGNPIPDDGTPPFYVDCSDVI